MHKELESLLARITGFDAVSLQPNAGSQVRICVPPPYAFVLRPLTTPFQGEYSGLLCIKKYHETRGEGGRNVCIIPTSAHGTNPATAVMAGASLLCSAICALTAFIIDLLTSQA